MTKSVSLQLEIELHEKNRNTNLENIEKTVVLVYLLNDGTLEKFPIEYREVESELIYIDIMFDSMKSFKEKCVGFTEYQGIYTENELGELVELSNIAKHSIIEVAEHGEFETLLYNPITLDLLK